MSKTRWEPDKENQNKAKAEIEELFDNGKKSDLVNPVYANPMDPAADGRKPSERPDPEFILACAKIAAFLMDKDRCTAHLRRLNQLVEARHADDDGSKVKTLRLVLEEELARLGFFPKFGKTFGNVSPIAFRAAISEGLLLKDASIGDESHGEFTHIIQWLMIAWEQEASDFLGCPAVNILKQMGDESAIYLREPILEGSENKPCNEQGVWDLVVDRFSKGDFRSPDELTAFILETSDTKLQTLKRLITARRKKRQAPGALDKLERKFDSPSGFYHKSKLDNVHEPQGSNIDLDAFKRKK